MTREEAIEVIKAYKDKLTNSASNQLDEDIEAFDMAIKALKQKPCDDAISRQEAIHCVTETEMYNETFAEAKMRIAELKPVLPKRKQGEWIDCQDEGYVECPICGSATNCDDNKEDLHYCFSCGAEMR